MSDPVIVALDGDIDLAVRDEVEERLADGVARAAKGCGDLYVDLGGVTFIDSTGLACIVRAAASLDVHGRRVRLCSVPPIVLRLLELTGMSDLVVPEPDSGA
jgi:anti-sigma B factor antagonist